LRRARVGGCRRVSFILPTAHSPLTTFFVPNFAYSTICAIILLLAYLPL
jgi:hypothetical protein